MKPKAQNEHDDGLLEYLEDIIGTAKYKQPIEDAAMEVESLNDVVLEKANRVAIVEKEKDNLEDQKATALEYVKTENELVSKQSALYQVFVAECGNNIDITTDVIVWRGRGETDVEYPTEGVG
jgi:structural maintenance of chromosome 4